MLVQPVCAHSMCGPLILVRSYVRGTTSACPSFKISRKGILTAHSQLVDAALSPCMSPPQRRADQYCESAKEEEVVVEHDAVVY
jgi:hypothetical protein